VVILKQAIITHTDIDGVAGGALYVYLTKLKNYDVYFTEPYLLHGTLFNVLNRGYDDVVIIDLGLNENTVESIVNAIRSFKTRILWFDHHVWNREWIDMVSGLAKLYVDTSTCGAGVVAKYADRVGDVDENFINELTDAVCNADLFRFNHKLSPWFMRLVRRSDNNDWRMYVFKTLANGVLWHDSFTEKVIERFRNEIESYKELDSELVVRSKGNVKVAAICKNDVENSFSAAYILGRYGVDIVAIVSNDGKVSLRSVGFNVRDLAVKLGGGGHPRAAGFKIRVPWKIRIKKIIDREAVSKYVLDVIIENLNV